MSMFNVVIIVVVHGPINTIHRGSFFFEHKAVDFPQCAVNFVVASSPSLLH